MKKLFAILLVIAMMATLTACGSGGKNDSDDKSAPAQTESSLNGGEQNDEAGTIAENNDANNETDTDANAQDGIVNDNTNTGDKNEDNNTPANDDKNQSDDSDSATTKPSGSTNAAHKHSYTAKVTKAATCGAKGVKTFTCSCGDKYTKDIAATGKHSWNEWKTTKKPTSQATGLSERKCKTCTKTETKSLDKIVDHFFNDKLDGRWKENDITILPKEVYFENGKLIVNCYIVNGYSANVTNLSVTKMTVRGTGDKKIAEGDFKAQNLSINALSYIEYTYTFSGDAIICDYVDMFNIGISADLNRIIHKN